MTQTDNLVRFTRLDGGYVKIEITAAHADDSPVVATGIVDANTWASGVAAVSPFGDTADAFWAIMGFHEGKPLPSGDELHAARSIIQQMYDKDARLKQAIHLRYPEWFPQNDTPVGQPNPVGECRECHDTDVPLVFNGQCKGCADENVEHIDR